MKSLFLSFAVCISSVGFAQAATRADQKAVLQTLVGSLGPVDMTEAKSYFFIGANGENLTINVDNDKIYILAKNGDNQADIQVAEGQDVGYMLTNKYIESTAVNPVAADSVSLLLTGLMDFNGQQAVFKTASADFKVQNTAGLTLDFSFTNNIFFKYDTTGDMQNWRYAPLANPEITKLSGSAKLVLALSDEEALEWGKKVASQSGETRAPEFGGCELESETVLKCDYYFETGYTPDTLHTTFSVKDGKIEEVTDVEGEIGC